MSEKTNRISKSIFEFSENQEDWKEAFSEFVLLQPLNINTVPVLGSHNCVCGAKIKHGRMFINRINKNEIYLGKNCEEYVLKKIDSVFDYSAIDKKNKKDNKSNLDHIKECIVKEDELGPRFICHHCYWILPKTEKQEGFTNKCRFCAYECKGCGGQKEKSNYKTCLSCYNEKRGYNKCSICSKFKLKPNSTFIKCYECLTNNKRPCCRCGKYKVSKITMYDNCFDCNKILKGKK